jgi:pimeloyl-ACP methyl ester carboxylesterase
MRIPLAPRLIAAALTVFMAAGCDTAPTAPSVTAPGLEAPAALGSLTSVPGVTEVIGTTGPGSSYALLVPSGWNGELVVYAKGYVQPFLPPSLAIDAPGVREWLLSQGFAVAWSSYSETGYAVKDGWQRTHQLKGLFASEFGRPARTYLLGVSMGGLIAELLSERFSTQYDGTLSVCGVLGGGRMNADYVAHFRVLFDHFYPGVLPGSLYHMPEGYLLIPANPETGYPGSAAFNAVAGAVAANPWPAMQMASMEEIGLSYHSGVELVTSFLHVLGYQINGANALTERLNGHGFFDNETVRYTGSADDDALNAGVARYTADPAAEQYLERWWEPTGRISRPFVALHTSRDPLVPVRSADVFAATVAAAGASAYLYQETIQAFGHCAFGPADIPLAFNSLVTWVRGGHKPG